MGYNLEPSEIGAAFGLVQLKKLDYNIEERSKNVIEMSAFFDTYKDWFILPKQLPDSKTGWLAFAVTIKDNAPFKRREFPSQLANCSAISIVCLNSTRQG